MHTATNTIQIDRQQSLADIPLAVRSLGFPVGIAALVVSFLLAYFTMSDGHGLAYFLNAYLIAFMFVLSISLGSLFLVFVTLLTRAGWSVGMRRVAEMIAQGVLPLMILFLPIALSVLLGSSALYPWNNPELVSESELLQKKTGYLNSGFFFIRYLIYSAVFIGLARYYFRTSLKQDGSGDPELTLQMERTSTWGAYLFAGSLTFAAVDWMMSLQPDWFSTIFGVYYFAGSAVACLAFMIIVLMTLQSRGLLRGVVNVEHFHDLGKLMFGFTCFWAYIAFSQYFLIWYANIPEETRFYLVRQGGQELETGWPYVSLALITGCFVLPFVGLMSRTIKRNRTTLFFWAIFILGMRYVDMYWLIRPNYQPTPDAILGPTFGLVDILCLIGIFFIWLGSIVWIASNRPIVAISDPRLPESLAFKNI